METGSLLFYLSKKSADCADPLNLCKSGKMVEILLKEFEKEDLLLPGRKEKFYMTLSDMCEVKAGLCIIYNT